MRPLLLPLCLAAVLAAVLAACETAEQQQPLNGFGRVIDGYAALSPGNLTCVEAKNLDSPPRRVRGTAPLYPAGRLAAGQSGSVVARYEVNVDGQIENLTLDSGTNSDPDSVWFRNHVAIAVRSWQIEPAKRAGVRVRATCQSEFRFILQ